ncbi:hypothetical protein [Senegalia massiliensis]|uniref:Uncharacterized protein n=1 Tax=Senegalia massiliensis TaxID=1720316 RepID=A0A845R014_9CLOT|nr:hypothetical protein [Senegalia massiliensis]NBI07544.1 hypothetical protein [Senegalia massiliensis]
MKKYANDIQDMLEDTITNYDGEAEVLISGIYEILRNDNKLAEKLGDNEDLLITTLNIINAELYFNYYTDIRTYLDLSGEIGYDDCLWEIDEEEGNEIALEKRDWLQNVQSEEKAKEVLNNDGWYLSTNGLAIGMMDKEDYDQLIA